jgi:hypothetical protein
VSTAATIANFTGCYVGCDGDEQARLYDCRTWPNRYAARRAYAGELGEPLGDLSVRVVYARWFTRQEQWDDYGRECWEPEDWDETGPEPEPPDEPPEDWEPSEEDPCWTSCKRTDPGAARCWRVEWNG